MKNFDTNGKRGRWRARQWAALAGLCLAGTLFGNAEAFAEGAGPQIKPATDKSVVTEVALVKSWRFQGKEYSLVKFPSPPCDMIFCILKKSEDGPEIILRHVAPYDEPLYEPSVDVVACDDFWALVRVDYAPGAYDVGKWYQFSELDLDELKERERKAEAWNPDRFCRYEENRLDFDLNSKLGLPVRGAGLPPRGGFIYQTWEFSSQNGSLIASPVGQKITQLKDVDFYRYDPDKKTWTPHNRDETEKAELSAVHSKSPNRENEDGVRNFRKWLEIVDRTEKVSRTEIDEVKRAFAGVDKAGSAPVGARILVFDGETPTTTDVLLLLSRQCNYTKCPNVCVEDEEYFYAWREGDFRHGTLVDRKNLSVRTWSFRDGTCVLYW